MGTPAGKATLGLQVDMNFKNKFDKPKEFWVELGEFFAACVGEIHISDWKKVSGEFPRMVEFFEKYIPEREK